MHPAVAHSTIHRAPRYQVVVPAVFTAQLPRGPHAGSGWTRDLSETGACLELRERVPPGTHLTVVLELAAACAAMEARVVWSQTDGGDGPVLHGIVFAPGPNDPPPALASLLERLRQEPAATARVPAALPVRCVRLDGAERAVQGWTSDIGHGGCCLLLPDTLPVGTPVDVVLSAPRGELTARGTVMWSTAASGGRQLCGHGVRFTQPAAGKDVLLALMLEDGPAAGVSGAAPGQRITKS